MGKFTSIRRPHLHLWLGDVSELRSKSHQLIDQLGHYIVRLLDGKGMGGKEGVFTEFAAALSFPNYFGKNWDAFDECVKDLGWLPAAGYVLVVSEAAELLRDDLKEMPILISVLDGAGESWAAAADPRPFHVAFGCSPEYEGVMEQRLGAAFYDACIID